MDSLPALETDTYNATDMQSLHSQLLTRAKALRVYSRLNLVQDRYKREVNTKIHITQAEKSFQMV